MSETIHNPTPEQLSQVAERYKGRGSAGDEWGVRHMRGDEYVHAYSGVGSVVAAFCRRLMGNPAACVRLRDVGDGVFFDLLPGECRGPETMVKPSPKASRRVDAAKRLGGTDG